MPDKIPETVTITDGETTITLPPADWIAAAQAMQAKLEHYRKRERIELLVELLFPKYDAVAVRQGRAQRPPIHPEKAWWWNGASFDDFDAFSDGTVNVTVTSYVGRGEYEEFAITLPEAWMTATDPRPLVLAWIEQATAERDRQKKAEELARAEREAQAAVAKLAALKGAQ